MKVTVYELLGMVKDGKAPKKIKYKENEYYLFDSKSYLTNDKSMFFDMIYFKDLAEEVEILEEEKKIPEKLNLDTDELRGKETPRAIDYLIESKINQVIDYLKSKGE